MAHRSGEKGEKLVVSELWCFWGGYKGLWEGAVSMFFHPTAEAGGFEHLVVQWP